MLIRSANVIYWICCGLAALCAIGGVVAGSEMHNGESLFWW